MKNKITAKQFIDGEQEEKMMTVEEFLHGFDPINWKIQCLMSNEITEQEWIEGNEQPFSD